jgi:alpha-glucosidase (family GH31 glycosyl hydrolase)
MFDLGFDGFMQDFGEQVVADMRFHNGESGTTMHNRYPVIYHRVTARIMRDYERSHPGRELFDYTRSGFSGRHGSQAYSNGDFPGDENTDWSDQNGLPTVIPDMLNRGIDGSWGFNTDVGGYANFVAPVTTAELFDRWAEAAALMPYFRVHMDGGNPQMPWTVGGNAAAVYTAMAKLHEAALPLIRARWAQAERTGVPIEEPLWMAYPDDARAGAQQEEFLLGHDVLVAPVVTQGATTNSVYFPAGCWTDQNTGRQYTGPATATVPAGLATLPYFFACGTRPF